MSAPDAAPRQPFVSDLTWAWVVLTATLTVICIALNIWSPAFDRAILLSDRPTVLAAFVLVAAGFISLLCIPLIWRTVTAEVAQQRSICWIIIAGGLAMRLALFGSTPILEDDYYRYLWDGGVAANGYNPYAVSPDDAQGEPYFYTLQPLAHRSGIVIERINHSQLTTVYPPVAQAAFAFAHLVSPWSLEAWRGVCLIAEIATLMLLISLLDEVGRSRAWVALYWLSPLAAKEFINSAHMDVIVMPFVLGAALLSLRQRHLLAVVSLGLAIGAKFWPVLLAPLVLRALLATPRRLALAMALLAVMCVAAALPMLTSDPIGESGLAAYATHWRNNSAHFGLIEELVALVLKPLAVELRTSGELARLMLAGSAGAFALWMARAPIENGNDMLARMGLVTAAIVLLSPSQFPWYALWVLPFLVFVPWSGLLLMTALIPIYYAGFYFLARDEFSVYREIVVFAIWLPVWALVTYEAWRVKAKGDRLLIEPASNGGHA